MQIVEWEERYNLGIEEIDGHHRHLVELLNSAYHAVVLNGNRKEAGYVFHELLDYSDYHFTAEEVLMRRYGYGGLDAHCAEHATFLQKVNDLLDRFLATESQLDADLICFLEEWLLNHIQQSDRRFADIVISKGYADS